MVELLVIPTVTDNYGRSVLTDDPITVNLYCYPHQSVHLIPLADVERIYLTLAGAEVTARSEGFNAGEEGRTCPENDIECPLVTLVRSHSSEGFLEHVEQGIACREAAHG